jgi:hypothetical protein
VPSPTTPQPAFANEWSARLAAIESAKARLTLPAALALLLDIRRDEDRQKIQTVDGLIRQQGPHTTAVMGVVNGHLAFGWRAGASVEQAREAALARCREQRATACSVVMVDEELRKPAFLEVATGLGSHSVAEARAAVLRGMDRAATSLINASNPAQTREAPALPAPSVPPVAPQPVRPPETTAATATGSPSPSPAREWAEAQAALRAAGGQLTLARAFAIVLNARAGQDIETLERFETAAKRLQWKSALALGEKNGFVQWGWRSRDQNAIWAAENAINACNRVSSVPCVVVMADGKFNEAGFLEFASRLGARPQTPVRESLVRTMQKRLDAGGF